MYMPICMSKYRLFCVGFFFFFLGGGGGGGGMHKYISGFFPL